MFDLESYGKTVSFTVYPVEVLGDIYKNVQIQSIVDYDIARQFSDIDTMAVRVYPMLPQGTPKDFKKYKYVKIKFPDGKIAFIAMEWINGKTVKVNQNVVITVKVLATEVDTLANVRDVLIANNFNVMEITTS